eukprot:13364_1
MSGKLKDDSSFIRSDDSKSVLPKPNHEEEKLEPAKMSSDIEQLRRECNSWHIIGTQEDIQKVQNNIADIKSKVVDVSESTLLLEFTEAPNWSVTIYSDCSKERSDTLKHIIDNYTGILPTIRKLYEELMSDDAYFHLTALIEFRKLLSIEVDPPIDEVIAVGAVPRLVQFLRQTENSELQFQAAWALTNVMSGTSSHHVREVLDNGGAQMFVELLASPDIDVREQSVWALGNIAGEDPKFRDLVLELGALPPLPLLCTPQARTSFLSIAAWTLSNFCRGEPLLEYDKISAIIPTLAILLSVEHRDVFSEACWAFCYFSDDPNDSKQSKLQAVVESGAVTRFMEILNMDDEGVVPALRCIANIASGGDIQIEMVLNAGILDVLGKLIRHDKKHVRVASCSVLSIITAGRAEHIDQVIRHELTQPTIEILRRDVFEVKKVAARAIHNVTSGGTAEQIRHLVQIGAILPFVNLFTCADTKTVMAALTGIENILKVGETDAVVCNTTNELAECVERCDGINKLEEIQSPYNQNIYNKTVDILTRFFNSKRSSRSLINAIKYYDLAAIRRLLSVSQSGDVNKPDTEGFIPLNVAAERGNVEAVKLLLDHPKIDVNTVDDSERTPLFSALVRGNTKLFRLLLKSPKVDVNVTPSAGDYYGQTPLGYAVAHGLDKIVGLLLQHPKIDVNAIDRNGSTLLNSAVAFVQVEIVRLLLEKPEIDVNKSSNGWNPLSLAAMVGSAEIVNLLLKDTRIDANKVSKNRRPALCWAALNGNIEIVRILLENPKVTMTETVEFGECVIASPLYCAVNNGHFEIVRLLMENPNVVDAKKWCNHLLECAIKAVSKHTQNIRHTIGNLGVSVSETNVFGVNLPNSCAFRKIRDDMNIIRFLLKYPKINVNAVNDRGMSVLITAALRGQTNVVRVLLENEKLNIHAMDKDGKTARMRAVDNGKFQIMAMLDAEIVKRAELVLSVVWKARLPMVIVQKITDYI